MLIDGEQDAQLASLIESYSRHEVAKVGSPASNYGELSNLLSLEGEDVAPLKEARIVVRLRLKALTQPA